MDDPRIEVAVQQAVDRFGEVLVGQFPEVKTGDFSPEATFALEDALRTAVKSWLASNPQ